VATFPFGINNRGHVVGFYLDADQVRHGFLFRNGEFTTIDHPLAAADTQAHDLNDRAQIAGLYERGAGQAAGLGRSAPNRLGDAAIRAHSLAEPW
jgi:probable HAF family extracellular repeat protein